MKKSLLLAYSLVLITAANAQEGHVGLQSATSIAQDKLTAADWQSDLRFLQQTVHKEYSFLF